MNLKEQLINREWVNILANEFNEKYFRELEKFIETKKKTMCPRKEQVFRALNLTSYNNTKIVIVGQDPYFTPGIADGLAFSNINLPPSLKNIFKEIESDIGIKNTNGDLTSWSNQGVLLINRILTTDEGKALAHENEGWEQFTGKIISALDNRARPVVFMLWGKKAQELEPLIKAKHHLILKSGHPSPYSVKTFSGNKHFSKANTFLVNSGQKIINWGNPKGD